MGLTDLSGIKKSRAEFLEEMGINTIKDLANANIRDLWRKISKTTEGKVRFQRESTIKELVSRALSKISGEPIFHHDLEPFEIKIGDAYFDMEYDTHEDPPVIFAICLGISNKNEKLDYTTWFAQDKIEVKSIVKKFYHVLESKRIDRAIGWSIYSADLIQLEKISPVPEEVEYLDLYIDFFSKIAFPTSSNKLKALSSAIYPDYERKSNIMDGRNVSIYYKNYMKTGNPKIKRLIIEYVKEDVLLTFKMANWLQNKFSEKMMNEKEG